MGTNYYLERDLCPHCGRPADRLHIGKSSGGWCFSLNTHPDERVNCLADWINEWSRPETRIVDEYGVEHTAAEMEQTITGRSWDRPTKMTQREYDLNSAEPGPNNLLRHKVDGRHCIAHGDGTYDLMRGEFC